MATLYVLLSFIIGALLGWKVHEICLITGLGTLLSKGDGVYFNEEDQQLVIDAKFLKGYGFREDEDASSESFDG